MDKKLFLQLAVIFFSTQIIGLATSQFLISQDVSVQLINDDKESVENSFGLIAYILLFTGLLLIFTRLFKGQPLYFLLKAFELLAIFGTSLLVFALFGDLVSLVLAVTLVGLRIVFQKNVPLRNISSIVATAGAGALIGVSLGIIPLIVVMILLAVYDYIAVFKTKHMVEIAKSVTSKNLSFTFALPTKEHQFELGTGDIVMPLAFASSIFAKTSTQMDFPFYFITPALIMIASFVGLVLTLGYLSKRIGIALPALPPQTVLMLIVFFAASLLGF